MGGERASTTRLRERGQICYQCGRSIDTGLWPGGERLCDPCLVKRGQPEQPRHRVYMFFMLRDGWSCQFLLPDLKTTAAPCRTYTSSETVRELAKRGRAFSDLASHQAFDYAVIQGRGSVWLNLTDEQFARLRRLTPAKLKAR